MKILITGAAGFTATHLSKLLAGQSDPASAPNELFFTSLRTNKPEYCTHHIHCDLTQFESVNSLLSSIRPDQIYHLAGSFTNDYALDYAANVLSTKNILEAASAVRGGRGIDKMFGSGDGSSCAEELDVSHKKETPAAGCRNDRINDFGIGDS